MSLDLLILVVSVGAVSLGASLLVHGASSIAMRAGVSPLFVGLTIVGFGTSAPELMASVTATLRGSIDVSVGNVVGSNIFNIAAILGITALLHPIRVRFSALRRDIVVAILAALVPWSAWILGGSIPQWLGVVLVGILASYLMVAFQAARRHQQSDEYVSRANVESALLATGSKRFRDSFRVNGMLIAAGMGLLVVGSRYFVGSAISIATYLGVSELVIGLTIVSAGTSLPELTTSLVAAHRGKMDIAVGNVIGSNIFNIFGILGVCAAVKSQTVNTQILLIDAPIMLLATLSLLPIMRSGGVISRTEGGILATAYAVYLGTMILRAS